MASVKLSLFTDLEKRTSSLDKVFSRHRYLCSIFRFLDTRSMVNFSLASTSWKDETLNIAQLVWESRFQFVIDSIHMAIKDVPKKWDRPQAFDIECERIKSVPLDCIRPPYSFGDMLKICDEVQGMIRNALLDPHERIVRVLDLDYQIEKREIVLEGMARISEQTVSRTARYGGLTRYISKVFRELKEKGLFEEALIVARLIPTESIDPLSESLLRHKATEISDSLQSIAIQYIHRGEINRVLSMIREIPNVTRRNQTYIEVMRFWLGRNDFSKALQTIELLEAETSRPEQYQVNPTLASIEQYMARDGVYDRRFVAMEEMAKKLFDEGHKEEALMLRDGIPDNDYDGCKKRLNAYFNPAPPSKCIVS